MDEQRIRQLHSQYPVFNDLIDAIADRGIGPSQTRGIAERTGGRLMEGWNCEWDGCWMERVELHAEEPPCHEEEWWVCRFCFHAEKIDESIAVPLSSERE